MCGSTAPANKIERSVMEESFAALPSFSTLFLSSACCFSPGAAEAFARLAARSVRWDYCFGSRHFYAGQLLLNALALRLVCRRSFLVLESTCDKLISIQCQFSRCFRVFRARKVSAKKISWLRDHHMTVT